MSASNPTVGIGQADFAVMKVKIIKEATLTVKAGQVVEISEQQATTALRLGFVEIVQEEKPVKKSAGKSTRKG